MRLHTILLSGAGAILALGLAVSGGSAKDSGFKIMMTRKWTGFPYFEAAAKARKRGIVVTTFDADVAQDARDMFVNQLSYQQAAKTMLDCALMDAPQAARSPSSPPRPRRPIIWLISST